MSLATTSLSGLRDDQLRELHEVSDGSGTWPFKMKTFDANSSRAISVAAWRVSDHCYWPHLRTGQAQLQDHCIRRGKRVRLGDPELVAERVGIEIWQSLFTAGP